MNDQDYVQVGTDPIDEDDKQPFKYVAATLNP